MRNLVSTNIRGIFLLLTEYKCLIVLVMYFIEVAYLLSCCLGVLHLSPSHHSTLVIETDLYVSCQMCRHREAFSWMWHKVPLYVCSWLIQITSNSWNWTTSAKWLCGNDWICWSRLLPVKYMLIVNQNKVVFNWTNLL